MNKAMFNDPMFLSLRILDYMRQAVGFVIALFILLLIRYFSSSSYDGDSQDDKDEEELRTTFNQTDFQEFSLRGTILDNSQLNS
jgi:hypothetical protein